MHYNNENTAVMDKNDKDLIWSTESLVMFGMWLVNKGERGYGLLCIHGSCFGIKIGSLLKLTWNDFINDDGSLHVDLADNFPSRDELILHNEKKEDSRTIKLSYFIQRYTREVYINIFDYHSRDVDAPIYINVKTGKVLTTSSLNRELNKLYEQFRLEVLSSTYLELKFRELKTNTFEIAWGRDMVNKYNCTKKVFIAISKYMGHRTVNDTIKLLELEPNEEIKFSFDLFDPDPKTEIEMLSILKDKEKLSHYLYSKSVANTTEEFWKHRHY